MAISLHKDRISSSGTDDFCDERNVGSSDGEYGSGEKLLEVKNGKEDISDVEFGITWCLFNNDDVLEMGNGKEDNSNIEFSITRRLFDNNDSNVGKLTVCLISPLLSGNTFNDWIYIVIMIYFVGNASKQRDNMRAWTLAMTFWRWYNVYNVDIL